MKKKCIVLLPVILLAGAMLFSATAYAAPFENQLTAAEEKKCDRAWVSRTPAAQNTNYQQQYQDSDGNGVCDNYELRNGGGRHHNHSFIDADNDGICDYGHGAGYTDLDGDGICDYGNGAAYIDENGDGVCDNYANNSCYYNQNDGQAQGRGNHGRWNRS